MKEVNKSPFIDDWENKEAKERYIFHAREIYKSNKEMERISQQAHLSYAKWILASLLAIHGGALYSINSIRVSAVSSEQVFAALSDAAIMNVSGIVFTLLTGGMAWINFQAAEMEYARRSNPAIVYRNDKFHDPKDNKTDLISATLFLSVVFTLFSLIFFASSSVEIFKAIELMSNKL